MERSEWSLNFSDFSYTFGLGGKHYKLISGWLQQLIMQKVGVWKRAKMRNWY